MVHALRKASTIVLALLLLAAPIRAGEPTFAAHTIPNDLLLAAVGMREEFGLPADVEYVATLMSSSNDVGSELWRIPLTAPEMQNLNLEARTSFQVTSQKVIDFARSLPDFGGAYFDQRDGGELILQFTQVSDSVAAEISQLASTDGPPTRIETVHSSFTELSEAMFATRDALRALAPAVELVSVGASVNPKTGLWWRSSSRTHRPRSSRLSSPSGLEFPFGSCLLPVHSSQARAITVTSCARPSGLESGPEQLHQAARWDSISSMAAMRNS